MQTLTLTRGLRGALLPLAAALLAACADMEGAGRPLVAVGEIPAADYEVRTVVAVAPAKQADGEVVAAILYLLPKGIPVQVWEGSYPTGGRGWLISRSLGKGDGTEHLRLVKSTSNYRTVMLPLADGTRLGYALVHKAVKASTHDARGEVVVVLNASDFIDQQYIGNSRGR